MSFLYLTQNDVSVKTQEARVIVTQKDGMTTSIPLNKLEGIVVMSRVNISTPCIQVLLKEGIPLTWLSSKGLYFGRLESTRHVNIVRQRKQFLLSSDLEFRLNIAKQIIYAKIHNQRVVIQRYNRHVCDQSIGEDLTKLKIYRNKVYSAKTINELIGFEGVAASVYFKALSKLVTDEFKFEKRTKRPPKDPFNSLLSFGYTLLLYDMYTAITNRGLHPYAAFIHQDRNHHPALASDLMEEWRAVIVDSLVMKLVQRHMIHADDFEIADNGGVFVKRALRNDFVKEYEKKMHAEIQYATGLKERISYRKALQKQVELFSRAIEKESAEDYIPISIR